jgi:hypothetical protein
VTEVPVLAVFGLLVTLILAGNLLAALRTTLAAAYPLGLVTAQHDLDVRAVSGEGTQISPLPGQRLRIIPNEGGEVSDGQDLVVWTQPLNEVAKIQPEVSASVLVMEPVVEVESIDVGDDGGHDAPWNTGRRVLVTINSTPSVSGPT